MLLDDQERARAQRYRLAAARDRFLLGAVLLRVAAARHLDVAPADVAVDRTCGRCGAQHGRPQLPGTGLNASVSHSGDVVAVALTWPDPLASTSRLSARSTYAAITDQSARRPSGTRSRTEADFYTFWTRKEAVLKATGEGLSRPMTDLQVTPPASAPVLLGLGSGPPDSAAARRRPARWQTYRWETATGPALRCSSQIRLPSAPLTPANY